MIHVAFNETEHLKLKDNMLLAGGGLILKYVWLLYGILCANDAEDECRMSFYRY